jgi:catechol 2,3-dioxygenase-like lactoylglutathione lyase family enzyme
MFSHIMLGSNNIDKSEKFYNAIFAAIGGPVATRDAKDRLIYAHKGGRLIITKPLDGKPATGANGGTIGFAVDNPDQVYNWHKAGIDNGGISIEDAPGPRQRDTGPIYLAYLRDPDGNKLCVVHRP